MPANGLHRTLFLCSGLALVPFAGLLALVHLPFASAFIALHPMRAAALFCCTGVGFGVLIGVTAVKWRFRLPVISTFVPLACGAAALLGAALLLKGFPVAVQEWQAMQYDEVYSLNRLRTTVCLGYAGLLLVSTLLTVGLYGWYRIVERRVRAWATEPAGSLDETGAR